MTNSRCNDRAADLFYTLFNLLCEEVITHTVDEPIDLSVEDFQLEVAVPITHIEFNRVIAAFIGHLYQKGIRLPCALSYPQALAKAVYILNIFYDNDDAKGYDGALLDAAGKGQEGLERVLVQLTEAVKAREREKYKEWVFACYLEPLGWEERKNLVIHYLRTYKGLLPDEFQNMDPARICDNLRELITNYVLNESLFDQMLRPYR